MTGKQPAVGYRQSQKAAPHRTQQRCVVGFDPETFQVIRDRAIREKTSFAEQVRLLVEWGLEAK